MSQFLRERMAAKNGEAIPVSPSKDSITNPWYDEGSSPSKLKESNQLMHDPFYVFLVKKDLLPPSSQHRTDEVSNPGPHSNMQDQVEYFSKDPQDRAISPSTSVAIRQSMPNYVSDLVVEVGRFEELINRVDSMDPVSWTDESVVTGCNDALKQLNCQIDEIGALIVSLHAPKQLSASAGSVCSSCCHLREENERLKVELVQLKTSVPIFRSPDPASSIPSVLLASDRLRTITASLNKALEQCMSYASCWDFANKGTCPRGEKCKWEHLKKLYSKSAKVASLTINTAPPPPPGDLCIPDESQFCWNYASTGSCPRGSNCRWIHELMMMPWPTPSEAGLAFPATPEGNWDPLSTGPNNTSSAWDQFAHHPSSSFNSSYYTTPLVVDHLTPEQIAKADLLSKLSLPSESIKEDKCQFCKESFASDIQAMLHYKSIFTAAALDGSAQLELHSGLKSAAKRRSWIVVQESLPAGLVSQIDGLYKRPITSSTNIQNMLDCIAKTEEVDVDTREYLLSELVALVVLSARQEA